jgi:hypothetical protein
MAVRHVRGHRWWTVVAPVVALLVTLLVPGAVPATAEGGAGQGQCAESEWILAVDARTGHLAEMESCHVLGEFGPAADLDTGDWRQYRHVFATRTGTVLVLYAVTAEGRLWSWRQDAPGAPLGAPVRVGADVDWSRFGFVFAPHPGALHAGPVLTNQGAGIAGTGPVRTFEHVDADAGGAVVRELAPLFTAFHRSPMTAARWGAHGEANTQGQHFRIWWLRPGIARFDDGWAASGSLPRSVTRVVGTEPRLYGVESGSVVMLRQARPDDPECPLRNNLDWREESKSGGAYERVVVPAVQAAPSPEPRLGRPNFGINCVPLAPYEWQ